MQMRRLGRTGLKVAPLCLGGNPFGWTVDEAQSFAVLDAYVEGGGNFIDTADAYSMWVPGNSGGESETILGSWMRSRGNRGSMVVGTKVCSPMGKGPNDRGLSRQHIMQAVEDSLRRLQTDYIDLYMSHNDDLETPLEETLRTYDDLVRAGKVRYIGASNHSAWRLMRALWASDKQGWVRYESLQPRYNLVDREQYERDLEAACQDQGLGVITYYGLASGFLSGKYHKGAPLPKSGRAAAVERGYMNDRGFAILDQVERAAAAHSATPAQVALAWVLARPSITAPIASATTPEQVRDLLGAAEVTLSEESLAALDAASAWRATP